MAGIDGIESNDASARLGGDLGLFRSMLERLLGEFAGLAAPQRTADAASLAGHAARLHKLRGSAGMLGAKRIQQLAGDAEQACREGDAARAADIAARRSAQWHALGRNAAPVLAQLPAPAGTAIDAQALADFVELLRQQSLSALDRFSALSPRLQRLLGPACYPGSRAHRQPALHRRGQGAGRSAGVGAGARPACAVPRTLTSSESASSPWTRCRTDAKIGERVRSVERVGIHPQIFRRSIAEVALSEEGHHKPRVRGEML